MNNPAISSEKANILADRAINNPKLLKTLPEETIIKFIVCVSKYSRNKAVQIIRLAKPGIDPIAMSKFWEVVEASQTPQTIQN